ncbi:MAG: thioesterase domain-containing protein [Pseudomonadota bacterium]|nr:thioesterase domain-containing protein [Pseudomonadota bacterium]
MTVDPSVASCHALVRNAWSAALAHPCDEAFTWEESGADSLASLNLIVILERSLGRKLSYDMVWPDMKVADLARLLVDSGVPRGPACLDAPMVFILPGMFGDDSQLAGFRRSFGGRLHFQLIDHPELTAPWAVLADVSANGRAAAREISQRQPEGRILLAGYSFGGGVAFEAARQLAEEGRQLGLLAVIDTPVIVTPPALLERPRRMMLRLIGRFDAGRRLALALIAHLLPAWSMAARRRLLLNVRVEALSRWSPSPLHTPGLLIVSDEFAGTIIDPWSRLCPGIRVVRVPARHGTVFDPASLAPLAAAFEQAVHLAHRGNGPPGSARSADGREA